jgi:carbonic anhydrase
MKTIANGLTLTAICAALASMPGLARAQDKSNWGYEGPAGAAHWGELAPGFKTCQLGKHQSPIDIDTRKVQRAALKPVVFSYKAEPVEVVNNGHTIKVTLPAGSTIQLDGNEYKLVEFHFHAPSEETFDGKGYPMVMHLVHRDAAGKLAAVAVLFKDGKENAALKPIFDNLPPKAGETKKLGSFNPAGLVPADHSAYAYVGSLTTPPCSEEVTWRILKTPLELSPTQLAAFTALYKMNARPVQPLNGRVVQFGPAP